MNGYLGNVKATADSFVDGWLKTGDIGTVDKHGKIFVVDRSKVSLPFQRFTLTEASLTRS